MAEWSYVEYEKLASSERSAFSMGPFGSKITKENYVAAGVPVIRGVNLARGIFVDNDFVYVTDEKADEIVSANARPGDLIFTHRGTIGQVSMIPRTPKYDRYVIGSSQVKTRVDESIALPEFYYYWFRSVGGQQSILANASTVGVPGIATPLTSIRKLMVPFPALAEQIAVAQMLGALDDKIAVNEGIVASAELLSSALFDGAAKEESTEFVDRPLSSVAKFVNGRAFTKDATGAGRMVVRIAEINSGPGASTVYNDIEVPDQHLARSGDLLFAWSGSLTVARWYRPEAIINQHIFKVIPKDSRPIWLIAQLLRLKLEQFRAIAADKATTMGHIQRRHLDETVLMPNSAMTQKLDAQVRPLWDRALAAERESLRLAALRDTLLPQLMSGKLRVRDVEPIVEDAV